MRSRSPSRTIRKPANATSAPSTDSSHAAATSTAAASSQPPVLCGISCDRVALRIVPGHVLRELGGAGEQRQDHADLPRRQRGEQQSAGRQPPLGTRLALRRCARGRDQRAQPLELVRPDRLQHDLAVRAAATGLHVHRMHAEPALDRPLLEIERLDARERDVGLLGADEPAPAVDRPRS